MKFKRVAEKIKNDEPIDTRDFDFGINSHNSDYEISGSESGPDFPFEEGTQQKVYVREISIKYGQMAILHVAVYYGNKKAVEDILSDGGDPNVECHYSERIFETCYKIKNGRRTFENKCETGSTQTKLNALELAEKIKASDDIISIIKQSMIDASLSTPVNTAASAPGFFSFSSTSSSSVSATSSASQSTPSFSRR